MATTSLIPRSTSKRPAAYASLSTGLLILGFSALMVRLANAPGTVSAFYRTAIAALLVSLPFLFRMTRNPAALTRRSVRIAILAGLFFGLDMGLWTTGVMLSGATNPTLMANTAPLWVGLGTWLIFKEKQSGKFWVGVFMAMFGAGLVLLNDLSRAAQFGIGTFLGLLAAVFYGGYFLLTQRGRVHLSTLSYFWIATLSSAVFLLFVNLLLKQPLSGYPSSTYGYFILMGVVVQVIGWLAINYAQGYLPASIVAPTMLGQPVLTALFASLLIGETFSVQQVFGGVIVIVGIYIVHRSGWQSRVASQN